MTGMLELESGVDVLDLGCGWGELLIRAVQASGHGSTGVGIDIDEQVLARGRVRAAAKGLDGSVHFVRAESATWDQPADRVLCIGASHAWAGVEQAIHALAWVVAPGGRVLFGEGCWERPPTAAAAALFGDDVVTLAEIVRLARAAGWQVLHLSAADQREWDDFEATGASADSSGCSTIHTTAGPPTFGTPSTRSSCSTSRCTEVSAASVTSYTGGNSSPATELRGELLLGADPPARLMACCGGW